MTLIEMEGFLRGKCLPGDMLVSETNTQYLHRQLTAYKATVANLTAQVQGLAAENAQMLRLLTDISDNHGEFVNEDDDYMYASVPLDYVSEINMYVSRDVNAENPFEITDAALAEIRNEARAEGINFAAGRLAAAFNNGFIDKPLAEVFDVTRMILTAKEEIANEPAADGLSGEYAETALKQWEEQLRKEASND